MNNWDSWEILWVTKIFLKTIHRLGLTNRKSIEIFMWSYRLQDEFAASWISRKGRK